jgi:hypothetical protein
MHFILRFNKKFLYFADLSMKESSLFCFVLFVLMRSTELGWLRLCPWSLWKALGRVSVYKIFPSFLLWYKFSINNWGYLLTFLENCAKSWKLNRIKLPQHTKLCFNQFFFFWRTAAKFGPSLGWGEVGSHATHNRSVYYSSNSPLMLWHQI